MTTEPEKPKRRRKRKALSAEARENEMIALAVDLAEEQLRSGKASTQVIVHYLKLATKKEELEQNMLAKKVELVTAQTENIKSAARIEDLYKEAISAMQIYSGNGEEEEEDPYD